MDCRLELPMNTCIYIHHSLVLLSTDVESVLRLPTSFMLRQFADDDFATSSSFNRTTPIISFGHSNSHPPSIQTEIQTRDTPAELGTIILYSLSSHRIPNRDTPVTAARGERAVNRMPGKRVHGINRVDLCLWIFYAVSTEGVILGLFGWVEEIVCYSPFY